MNKELERKAGKELDVPDKPQTIAQIVEVVCEEICDHYCKWPDQYKDEDALIEEKCNDCPLNRL